MDTLNIGISGASGKFGRSLIAEALSNPGIHVAASVGSSRTSENYRDLFEKSAVVIDVSVVENLENMLTRACHAKKPLVVGTTGHDRTNLLRMEEAAKEIPLFYASNFSLGIALLTRAAALLSSLCTADFAIDETHHIHKKDSPSGTALGLARALKKVCGRDPSAIKSERIGEVVGKHTVTFFLEEEEITLSHSAHSRAIFAQGALRAAKFLARQSPGFYSMDELLQEDISYATCKN